MTVKCTGIQTIDSRLHGITYAMPVRPGDVSVVPRKPGHREEGFIDLSETVGSWSEFVNSLPAFVRDRATEHLT